MINSLFISIYITLLIIYMTLYDTINIMTTLHPVFQLMHSKLALKSVYVGGGWGGAFLIVGVGEDMFVIACVLSVHVCEELRGGGGGGGYKRD